MPGGDESKMRHWFANAPVLMRCPKCGQLNMVVDIPDGSCVLDVEKCEKRVKKQEEANVGR